MTFRVILLSAVAVVVRTTVYVVRFGDSSYRLAFGSRATSLLSLSSVRRTVSLSHAALAA